MSEPTTPTVAGDAAGEPASLSPERIEAVLADFRAWLTDLATADAEPDAPASGVDLHTLVGQYIALRQEVNLQTRATRAQQEQNRDTLDQLQRTVDALTQARAAAPRDDDALRPFLKTLLDLDDTFRLASQQLQRSRQAVEAELALLAGPVAELPRLLQLAVRLTLRMMGEPAQAARRRDAEQTAGRVRGLLDSLIAGYDMSLRRLQRVREQHQLEPIASMGRPFDPEEMEVVEVVADSGRPAGEVVEEVRPGYRWQGRLFRYAQVRVAGPA